MFDRQEARYFTAVNSKTARCPSESSTTTGKIFPIEVILTDGNGGVAGFTFVRTSKGGK
jgi:hypothetical protein